MAKKKKKVAKKKTASISKTGVPYAANEGPVVNAELVEFGRIVDNALTSRSQFVRSLLDPRRNINDECGYPETQQLTVDDFKELYVREAIASRVVKVLPEESWKVQPSVFEDENLEVTTPFEEAWKAVDDVLQGKSWHNQEEGNSVWSWLERVDVQSGIGTYGVLLLGLDDGKPLNEPAEFREGQKILYLRTLDESLADITRFEDDPTSERYGLPTQYLITFNDPDENFQSGIGLRTLTNNVHWSRVIHVADNRGSNVVFGVSRIKPSYNRLYDLRKLYSGSAEMYWKGAFPGLSIESHPQLGTDVEVDVSGAKSQMENYMNGLQRYMSHIGFQVKSLAPQVVDPTPQIDAEIKAVCIEQGIPKRIFEGSERGELASSQDARAWNSRLQKRQERYITPHLIVPFVDRLILLGVLPEPTDGYSVVWPEMNTLTDLERATVAKQQTEAMAIYVQAGIEAMVQPMDYLVRFMDKKPDEVKEILKSAAEAEPLFDEDEEDDEEFAGSAGADEDGTGAGQDSVPADA